MKYLTGAALVILAAAIFLTSCSRDSSPVEPPAMEPAHQLSNVSNSHSLWGMYTFTCDPGKGTVEVIPLREADMHLNALKFLEPPALVFLKIEGQPQFNGNILDVDIGLTNPYLGWDQFTGFDVCGIVFTHGSVSGFSDPDIVMAGDGDTHLLNPDGYTRWWNPLEFPHGDTVNCYIDGMIGTPAAEADFNCTINGYKYFADGLDKDDPLTELDISKRGMFSAWKKNVRHYKIDMSGGFIFNYAVDACWKKPAAIPPQNIPGDFPPEANRVEAWNVVVTELKNTLCYEESTGLALGEMIVQIDVWDHYNCWLNEVCVESTAGIPLASTATPVGFGAEYSTYMLELTGLYLTTSGDAELLISVKSESENYGGSLTGEIVTAYYIHQFEIDDDPNKGWVRTWGGSGYDYVNNLAFGDAGDLYITGPYQGIVDFDPGDEMEMRISEGDYDIYLSKFNKYGDFQWVAAWGGPETDTGAAVTVNESGDVYITGGFHGEDVDFDPGPGTELRSSNGAYDAFLCKLDNNGNFLWVRVFGGYENDCGNGLAVDLFGNVYIVGTYSGTVDFNPGPGIDEHTSNHCYDIFLSKFDPYGEFQWCVTWGGNHYASDESRSIIIDNQGNIYVGGRFGDTVDFNPGVGVDEHISHGKLDAFISKFSTDGVFHWAVTWGGAEDDAVLGMAMDDSGNIYATGYFQDTVDFDPGPNVDNHISSGSCDSFLTKFNTFGDFQWALTWGSDGVEFGETVTVDNDGFILVGGEFENTVDFAPESGVMERESNGSRDVYVSKFNHDGGFAWVSTWGGVELDRAVGMVVDSEGYIYSGGDFGSTVDFDPGPDVFELTSNGYYDVFLCKLQPDGTW